MDKDQWEREFDAVCYTVNVAFYMIENVGLHMLELLGLQPDDKITEEICLRVFQMSVDTEVATLELGFFEWSKKRLFWSTINNFEKEFKSTASRELFADHTEAHTREDLLLFLLNILGVCVSNFVPLIKHDQYYNWPRQEFYRLSKSDLFNLLTARNDVLKDEGKPNIDKLIQSFGEKIK